MSKIIDLSKYNVVADWGAVANSVDGVIIRAGYRGYGSGKVVQDAKFVEFAQACKEKGIPFGIYFMSQAITVSEAEEEAQFAATFADQYGATLPLFIDSEDGDGTAKVVRADGLSKEDRTAIVKAFCEKVSSCGKEAGVYASESWFKSNLDYDQIKQYKIWCAKYGTNDGNAQTSPALVKVDMWQYTSKGTVSGINGNVDMDVSFEDLMVGDAAPVASDIPTYEVGKTYTLQVELKVRTGAGINYPAKTRSQISTDARNHDADRDGAPDKGTVVTCKEVAHVGNDIWIRTPSGWMAAYYQGKVYIK